MLQFSNIQRKDAFLAYLYGYLNLSHVNMMHKPECVTWKEYKVQKMGIYLGLSQRMIHILTKVYRPFQTFELLVSVLIVLYRFLYCIIIKIFLKKKPIDVDLLSIGEGFARHSEFLKKTSINKNDVVVITIPFVSKKVYKEARQVCVLSNNNYSDITIALIWSIRLMFYMNKKYKRLDIFMRYYSSFEFFLAFIFSHKVDTKYIFLFFSTYTRWAYLNGGLTNRKIFVQHGYLSGKWRLVKKIGRVDYGYYINEDQREICEKMLFENRPSYDYLEGLKFTLLPPTEKISVLLIGNNNNSAIEEKILLTLSRNSSLILYVKPHPDFKNKSFYDNMRTRCNFVLLGKNDYPQVQYVFSYNSTLATQYEDAGVTVHRYVDIDFDEQLVRISKMSGKQNEV